MATRSRIGILTKQGWSRSVYCHYDGYPSGVGKTLMENYDNGKVGRLLDLGDIRFLGTDIGEKPIAEMAPDYDMTSFFIRDHGDSENVCGSKIDQSFEDFLQRSMECHAEWYYLLQGGVWYFGSTDPTSFHYRSLRLLELPVVMADRLAT